MSNEHRNMIIEAILKADLTLEDCHTIQNTLRDKRNAGKQQTIAEIKYKHGVGTRVRLSNNMSPKFLNGCTGVIKSIRNTRCSVELDAPLPLTSKFRGARSIIVPLSALTPLSGSLPEIPEIKPNTNGLVEFMNNAD